MGFPEAFVIIAAIGAFCFLVWLKKHNTVDFTPLEKKIELQNLAISNLAKQTVDEVSKIKDRMGTMSLALGMKAKEKSA